MKPSPPAHERLGPVAWLLIGLDGALVAALVFMALLWAPAWREVFADFGGALPLFSRVVLSAAWLWSCVGAVLVMIGAGVRSVPRRHLWLALALVVGSASLLATIAGIYMPIFDLAGPVEETELSRLRRASVVVG
ncbi:MAG: hypothetical protein KF901_10240 [Myxococcales bacterium]|nr:hypothetical protein [Myxococcales bacterium]